MKTNRNLLYPIPISEVPEDKIVGRIEEIVGHKINRIDLEAAAEYQGVLSAIYACEDLKENPFLVNGKEMEPARLAAYMTGSPEALSFAFKHAHGTQRLSFIEKGKKGKPDRNIEFDITDYEFNEKFCTLFGIATDKESNTKFEYLLYLFFDNYTFFKSPIGIRKVKEQVYPSFSEKQWHRFATICTYAYKYLKRADEIRLSKITEHLTKRKDLMPGKDMFRALFEKLVELDFYDPFRLFIDTILNDAFHRYLQTSLSNCKGILYLEDDEGIFETSFENMHPTIDKKGLCCKALRSYNESWNNYWMNIEYDFKQNTFTVFDDKGEQEVQQLRIVENEDNIKAMKCIRRCISSFYNAKKEIEAKQ